MGLWLPLGLYFQFARVPAVLVIGSWFTLQLIYSVFGPDSGTVGWWGHVAGFMAGVVLALCLRLFSFETHLILWGKLMLKLFKNCFINHRTIFDLYSRRVFCSGVATCILVVSTREL